MSNIVSTVLHFADGSKEVIDDSVVILSYNNEDNEITIRASKELSNEVVVEICRLSCDNLEMVTLDPPSGVLN